MSGKEYCVMGLGRFGSNIAITLEQNGCQVLAIDANEEKVQEIAPFVTNAVCADVSDRKTMRSFGIGNMDGALICIGENLEASIFATILSKECGAKQVIAKASTELHAEVLRKVGADRIIFPEKDTAVRLGNNLASGGLLDIIELSDKFSMVETVVPERWVGKTFRELELRKKGINVIGRKTSPRDLEIHINPDEKIGAADSYIVIGNNKDLERELQ